MRGSLKTSIAPTTAAKAAMTRPAPISQRDAVAQNVFPVCQKRKSHKKAATKNAMGKGISIGCSGWPAIDTVLLGLLAIGVGMVDTPAPQQAYRLNAQLFEMFL